MNVKKELETKVGIANGLYLNNIEIDPFTIKAVMINEVVPPDPVQDFYGEPSADYQKTIIPFFQFTGNHVSSIFDILQMGIYVTNAVKTPKVGYSILLIEKSKVTMIIEDIAAMLKIIDNI
mgnify:CR=1 FL=1